MTYAKWSKNLPPTYDDYTKTFTFLFDITDHPIEFIPEDEFTPEDEFWITLAIKKTDYTSFPLKLGTSFNLGTSFKLGTSFRNLDLLEFVNNDICKYKFDHQNYMCSKRVIKVNEEGKKIYREIIYSFTIAAWKIYYILDCLKVDEYVFFLFMHMHEFTFCFVYLIKLNNKLLPVL
jgi:hypothetical protein